MENIIQVDVVLLNFLVGSLIPLLTALFTKVNASSGLKSTVNLVLSLVTGTAGYLLLHDGAATVVALATHAITAYLGSGVSYQNLWKPTGVAPAIQASTADVGVGGHRVGGAA